MAVEDRLDKVRQMWGAAAAQFKQDWRRFKIYNRPDFRVPVEYSTPATGAEVDGTKWPSVDDLIALLNEAHDAQQTVTRAWRAIPMDRQNGLTPPPG
jgi:hypothetical protein